MSHNDEKPQMYNKTVCDIRIGYTLNSVQIENYRYHFFRAVAMISNPPIRCAYPPVESFFEL